MTRYELMDTLDANGWSCKYCSKKKEVKDLVAEPYSVNVSTNKWYFFKSKGTEKCLKEVFREYLLCLVTADTHQQPVPHFKTAQTYRKIMDPAYVAKPRRRRLREVHVGEDDWEVPAVIEPRKRAAAKRTPRRPRLPHDEGGDGAGSGDAGSNAGSDEGSDASSGSSSSSSKSSKSSKSSSSSSSSGSPGSSSSSKKENAPPPAPSPPSPRQDAPEEQGQDAPVMPANGMACRISAHAIPFGTCWLTPRYEGQVEARSWQISCVNPDHCREERCTKEHRVATAGSADLCLRRLMHWLILGHSEAGTTRADHRAKWKDIVKLQPQELPTMAELDAAAPGDESTEAATPAFQAVDS